MMFINKTFLALKIYHEFAIGKKIYWPSFIAFTSKEIMNGK